MKWWLFGLLLLLASVVRFYQLGVIPHGYNWDEVSIAYNAWSISLWHRDETARLMPLSFTSFGDYKPPFQIYALALLYALFDFHLEWVRILSALAGILTVALAFFIAEELFTKIKLPRQLAFIVMALVALSPWSVTLSRVGYEQNTTFFVSYLNYLLLIEGFIKTKLVVDRRGHPDSQRV